MHQRAACDDAMRPTRRRLADAVDVTLDAVDQPLTIDRLGQKIDGTGMRGTHRIGNVAMCRSEEHTSELQSLMRISYAVFCLKKKKLILLLFIHIIYYHQRSLYIYLCIQ